MSSMDGWCIKLITLNFSKEAAALRSNSSKEMVPSKGGNSPNPTKTQRGSRGHGGGGGCMGWGWFTGYLFFLVEIWGGLNMVDVWLFGGGVMVKWGFFGEGTFADVIREASAFWGSVQELEQVWWLFFCCVGIMEDLMEDHKTTAKSSGSCRVTFFPLASIPLWTRPHWFRDWSLLPCSCSWMTASDFPPEFPPSNKCQRVRMLPTYPSLRRA